MQQIAQPIANLSLLFITITQLFTFAEKGIKIRNCIKFQRFLQYMALACILSHILHQLLVIRAFYLAELNSKKAIISITLINYQYFNVNFLKILSILAISLFVSIMHNENQEGTRKANIIHLAIYWYTGIRIIGAFIFSLKLSNIKEIIVIIMDVWLVSEAVVLCLIYISVRNNMINLKKSLKTAIISNKFTIEKIIDLVMPINKKFIACMIMESMFRAIDLIAQINPVTVKMTLLVDIGGTLSVAYQIYILQAVLGIIFLEDIKETNFETQPIKKKIGIIEATLRFFRLSNEDVEENKELAEREPGEFEIEL